MRVSVFVVFLSVSNERYDFIFFLFVPFDGDFVTVDGATDCCSALAITLSDHTIQNVCACFFAFADIVFYPRAFNFPFAVLQTQPKCILLLIDFYRFFFSLTFFFISLPYCCCCCCCSLLLVACRTVYCFHRLDLSLSLSVESQYRVQWNIVYHKNKRSGKRKKRAQTNWRNATKPKIRNENFSFNFLSFS